MRLALVCILSAGCGGPGGHHASEVREASGILDERGGAVHAGGVTVSAAPGGLASKVGILVRPAKPPPGLHPGLRVVAAVEIKVDEPDALLMPLTIQMRYDEHAVGDKTRLLPLHHSKTRGYEVVTLLDLDPDRNTITFESRDFSAFILTVPSLPVPDAFSVGFRPEIHGWQIGNHGYHHDPGGMCRGMSTYAAWHFSEKEETLYGRYPDDIAMLTSALIDMADGRIWSRFSINYQNLATTFLSPEWFKRAMFYTGKPMILSMLGMREGQVGGHSGVLYAYDEEFFYFYDPECSAEEQKVAYGSYFFESYRDFDVFSFMGLPSFSSAFYKETTRQARGDFHTSPIIQIESPKEGQVVTGEVHVRGSLQGSPFLELAMTSGRLWLRESSRGIKWHPVHEGRGEFAFQVPEEFDRTRLLFLAGASPPFLLTPAALVVDFTRAETEPPVCKEGSRCLDACANATPIDRCPFTVQGADTSTGRSYLHVHSCSVGTPMIGPEHIYSFCAGRDGQIDVALEVLEEDKDLRLVLLEDGCGVDNCTEMHSSGLYHSVEKGRCYYIVVDGYIGESRMGDSSAYNLSLECR